MFLPKDLRYYQTPIFTVPNGQTREFFVDIPSTARVIYSIAQLSLIAGGHNVDFVIDNDVIINNTGEGFFSVNSANSYPSQPAPGRLIAAKCHAGSQFRLPITNNTPGPRDYQYLFTYLEYDINVAPRKTVGFDLNNVVGTNNWRLRFPGPAEKLISFTTDLSPFLDTSTLSLTIDNQELISNVDTVLFSQNFGTSNYNNVGYLNYPVNQNSNIFLNVNNPLAVPRNFILYYK